MENQWIGGLATGKALDATQENEVVAARIMRLVTAFEPRRAALDQGYSGQPWREGERVETILVTAGETVRDDLLIGGQDIDGVMAGVTKGCESRGVACEAPQDQGRVEGNGVEGTDGEADRLAVGSQCGQHGDAGGKAAECVAKVAADQIPGGPCVTGITAGEVDHRRFQSIRGGAKRGTYRTHQAIRTLCAGVLRFEVGKNDPEFCAATDSPDTCKKPSQVFLRPIKRVERHDHGVSGADIQTHGHDFSMSPIMQVMIVSSPPAPWLRVRRGDS
jgi:hypothetical protein